MKRNMDLVRLLLLRIEEESTSALRNVPEMDGFDAETVVHHVALMIQAGLLIAIDASTMQERDYLQIELTWQGHEFLETVRDPEVWTKTKEGAAKVGSWSIGVLAEIGKAVVTAKLKGLGFGE